MRFILDNDVRILGIFPCPMHDLPNICRSMMIVQMLVCFAIIIMHMEFLLQPLQNSFCSHN